MDREQHVVQDAAELYAVYVMQKEAERLRVAIREESDKRYSEFRNYLSEAKYPVDSFESGKYEKYKSNADAQLPRFVQRLTKHKHYEGHSFSFENVEVDFRNQGLKGDFVIHSSSLDEAIPVSLKNYIGTGGILRPQVGSGTFLSFAAGFVFERVGVGTYADPRPGKDTFQGANIDTRNEVLRFMGNANLIPILAVFDQLQQSVRDEFLTPEYEFYDENSVKTASRRVAAMGAEALLDLFSSLGSDRVRERFLERVGLDGREEALYFDKDRYLDSITNQSYHDMRVKMNEPETLFEFEKHGQGIRFIFRNGQTQVLSVHVPLTINTNGAWYRPRERYEGTQVYDDCGHMVSLRWGQRRPYKSKQIATSTNTYVNLQDAGILVDE